MGPVLWWNGTLLVTVLVVGWVRGPFGGPRLQGQRAAAFARRTGLAAVTPELVRRVVRRQRFVFTGAVLGYVAGFAVDAWFVPVYAGLALGAVADAVSRPGPPPGTPRVAHATSSRLRDYVPAWLLGVAAAAGVLPPVLALLWAVAPRTERDLDTHRLAGSTVGWLLVATAAAVLGAFVLARLVVGRRQPAGTADELAVDDALRAQAVRDVLQLVPMVVFTVGFVLALGLTEQDVDGVSRRIGGWFPLALLLAIVVVGTVHEWTGGPKHWRSRLAPAA